MLTLVDFAIAHQLQVAKISLDFQLVLYRNVLMALKSYQDHPVEHHGLAWEMYLEAASAFQDY